MSQHWSNAFYKFGYDDGDGVVETAAIAALLEAAGYKVIFSKWPLHNSIIHSIKLNGVELMPVNNVSFRVGYDDPRLYLPVEIIKILADASPSKTSSFTLPLPW